MERKTVTLPSGEEINTENLMWIPIVRNFIDHIQKYTGKIKPYEDADIIEFMKRFGVYFD